MVRKSQGFRLIAGSGRARRAGLVRLVYRLEWLREQYSNWN